MNSNELNSYQKKKMTNGPACRWNTEWLCKPLKLESENTISLTDDSHEWFLLRRKVKS